MILVIASQVDDAAQEFVADFPQGGAALLTCRDLSRPGWHISSDSPASSIAVADGKEVRGNNITGVLTLLPCIFPQELIHIVEADRIYVANEMTSFLWYWLLTLNCPVLNRPTSGCLSGPNWKTEQWLRAAYRLGIPVKEYQRSTREEAAAQGKEEEETFTLITLVGDCCYGSENEALSQQVKLLADVAGVRLLSAGFYREGEDYYFTGAHASADITSTQVRTAISSYFTGSV
jgi:hypothetical protein